MRFLLPLIAALPALMGTPARALSDGHDPAERAKALVAHWLEAQNRADFAAYSALYSSSFTGIRRSGARTVKLDRDRWLRERERMFQKNAKVEANDIRVTPAANGTTIDVELDQRWQSAGFGDVGKKKLTLVTEGGALRISYEEMLNSRPIIVPGERVEIFAPMRSLKVAKELQTSLSEMLDPHTGGPPGRPDLAGPFVSSTSRVEDTPPRISFGVCEGAAAKKVETFFGGLFPGLVVRPSKRDLDCPLANTREPDDGGWHFRGPESVSVGKNTLVVFVLEHSEDQQGDFARAYRHNLVLAVLRDRQDRVLDHSFDTSESDYSPLESIAVIDGKVVVTEQDVEDPCDGTDRHRYREYVRKYTVSAGGREPKVTIKTSRKLRSSGRCADNEARIYRDAEKRAKEMR